MLRHLIRGLALTLMLVGPALAWPMAANQRIDRALYHDHGPRRVVAGHVEAHMVDALADASREMVPPRSHVVFVVEHHVVGPDVDKTELRFSTRSFMWPEALVPLKKGERAFVIYDPRRERGFDGYVLSVVPWSGRAPSPVRDRDGAKRLLASELVAALAAESLPARQGELILQMMSIVSAGQAEAAFTPFLESSDEWLRRAAVAGLAYVSLKAAHVQRAVQDLSGFIRRTPANAMLAEREGEPGIRYAAYGMLFRYYAFLQTNWSGEERERVRHCLPLFRLIATDLDKAPHYHWEYGMRALCLLGTADDLAVLHAFYDAHETAPGGKLSDRSHVRMMVIRKLAELLKVELVASIDRSEIRKEREQKILLYEALAKLGLGEEAR